MENRNLMKYLKDLKRGSMFFIVGVVVFLMIVLFTFFAIIVFKNNVNLVLHGLKNDLFLISRNSIFSIEKNLMADDIERIDEDDLKHYISNEISEVWNLDYRLSNGRGIIKSADILELEVLEEGDNDSVSGKEAKCFTVHLVVGVKVKPIILNQIFDDIFYFKLHEDLKLNKLES